MSAQSLVLLCTFSLLQTYNCFGTVEVPQDTAKTKPTYLSLSSGISISRFRDFATSPLYYSGSPFYSSISYIEWNDQRESDFTLAYSVGDFESRYNNELIESAVNTFSLRYIELFALNSVSSSNFNLKIGGAFSANVNHRFNAALFNNREGLDLITNLTCAIKSTWNFSPRQNISFLLNVGLLNSSYCNGFAYTSPSGPVNTDDFFAGYEFKIFSGFRSFTAIDYTIFLKNNNAIQFSYLWDAYLTSAHHENFEMASHVFKFSLLFNLQS